MDYCVLAHLHPVNPGLHSSSPPASNISSAHHSPISHGRGNASFTDWQRPVVPHGDRPLRPPPRLPNFTAEDHAYLQARLPVRQPATAQTVINHFQRLPFLFQDLADASRARLAVLASRGNIPEREKRKRMTLLAQRLANRYHKFWLVLPRSYMENTISQWQSEPRASKFWDKVLDDVQKANRSWLIARLWIVLFVLQSTLVAVSMQWLSSPGQVALLAANALVFVWSTTVMCEMLHTSYTSVDADEQELHDLMGNIQS